MTTGERTEELDEVRTVPFDDVPEGDMLVVDVAGQSVVLAKLNDRVFAIERRCSHADGWLDFGELDSRTNEIECPLHGGRFDLPSGMPTMAPCTAPIRTYQVSVRDGYVHVYV